MLELPRRYVWSDWTSEEFERAITSPTPADRGKWAATDWGHNRPLIPMPKEEREALRASREAVAEKIGSTPEDVECFMTGMRRISAQILGPEGARFYAEHVGLLGPREAKGGPR